MKSTIRPQYATYNGGNYGPTFGGGHDLYIADNCRSSGSSYSNLGHSYKVNYYTGQKKKLLAGSYRFRCAEYEVYYLTTDSQRRAIQKDLARRRTQYKRLRRTLAYSPILKNTSQKIKTRLYNFIRGMSGPNKEWTRCFTASRHRYQSQEFHRNCDNKGPTLVLVRSGSHVFGGYTPLSWDCKYEHTLGNQHDIICHNSFLFSKLEREITLMYISITFQHEQDTKGVQRHSSFPSTMISKQCLLSILNTQSTVIRTTVLHLVVAMIFTLPITVIYPQTVTQTLDIHTKYSATEYRKTKS